LIRIFYWIHVSIGDNKTRIRETNFIEKLLSLEKWATSDDYKRRQVGFSAQWLLDNSCKSFVVGLRDALEFSDAQPWLSAILFEAIINAVKKI